MEKGFELSNNEKEAFKRGLKKEKEKLDDRITLRNKQLLDKQKEIDKLKLEKQIAEEHSGEFMKEIEELKKQKQKIIKKEGYPATDIIAVIRKEVEEEKDKKLQRMKGEFKNKIMEKDFDEKITRGEVINIFDRVFLKKEINPKDIKYWGRSYSYPEEKEDN